MDTPKLETLEAAKQHAINLTVNGFNAQGWERSLDASGRCTWLNEQGHRCAVGHLLVESSENFTVIPAREQSPSIALIAKLYRPEFDYIWETEHAAEFERFLRRMQVLHDRSRSTTDLHLSFRTLARQEGLTWPT